jgi:hypothetical protein
MIGADCKGHDRLSLLILLSHETAEGKKIQQISRNFAQRLTNALGQTNENGQK